MKYIKLTDLSGETTLVNMDKITSVEIVRRHVDIGNSETEVRTATLLVSTMGRYYEQPVKETPEEIWKMLNKE